MNKDDISTLAKSEAMLSHDTETTLEHVMNIIPPLIHWLIKSGVGYHEFTAVLKGVFYNEAIKELEHIHQKKTDSAISLLAGLNRREVRSFCQTYGEYAFVNQLDVHLPISVPARVIGLWVSQKLPLSIPFQGDEYSFESLVRQVSSEKHPKSILLELKRLGIVQDERGYVTLQNSSFTPNPQLDESKQLFSQNISDHLLAGIANLTQKNNFLEQAVVADELSQASIDKLNQLSVELWDQMSKTIVSAAIAYCQNDQNSSDANHRFRLGIYQYDE